jgi:LCP family protein required for cell wall assembly
MIGKSRGAHVARLTRDWRFIVLVIALPMILVSALGVFGFAVWQRIDRVHVLFPGSPTGGTTYLLVGSDSRAFVTSTADRARFGSTAAVPGERADLVLLLRVQQGGRMRVLALPRDLLVQEPNGASTRLALTLLRGPQALVDSICTSFGVGVDHIVLLHFDGLRRLVDTVGGVDVQVAAPMRDSITGLHLARAGRHHLDGQDALAYIRSRHVERLVRGTWQPEPMNTDARSRRAREVLAQLGSHFDVSWTAPLSTARQLWAFSGAITVDDGADPFVLRDLAHGLARFQGARPIHLPVFFHPGDIPTADLEPAARVVLAHFDGGPTNRCIPGTSRVSDSSVDAAHQAFNKTNTMP